MTPVLVLSALLSLPPTQARPTGVPAFQPRSHITFQSAVAHPLQQGNGYQIVCGMVVMPKTTADDPKIVLPPRPTGAAVRRIEPRACTAKATVAAK